MGVTNFSLTLIEQYLPKPGGLVCELGAQNNYTLPGLPAPYMRDWYEERGLIYLAIDIDPKEAHPQVLPHDLTKPVPEILHNNFDLVTDFGTSEHCGEGIDDYYQVWLNKWNLCKEGGIIISENPESGSWPGHGKHYLKIGFYERFRFLGTLDEGRHAAMSNITDGWNIYGVIQKLTKEFGGNFHQSIQDYLCAS